MSGSSASPPPLPSARSAPREWSAVKEQAVYPAAFEDRASACPTMTMSEAIALGADGLAKRGPTRLTNGALLGGSQRIGATSPLTAEVGKSPMRMLVMPTDVHPTLDTKEHALVEPAASGVFFSDYLRLLDRLADTEEFAVYVAQLNLLRLPPLLKQVCLPAALPADKLTMCAHAHEPTPHSYRLLTRSACVSLHRANLWVGGHSMKNGLHFDNFDNLLFQIAGSKRAILFPPEDSPHLYYSSEGVNIRRHAFNLKGGFANETTQRGDAEGRRVDQRL